MESYICLTAADIRDPVAKPEVNTRYFISGTTKDGCKTVDSIDVYVNYESLIDVPNAFAPDAPGGSNFFVVRKGIVKLKYFRVYNRWGNKVFETFDVDKGWNGSYNGVPQPQGVYVYVIEAETALGKRFYKQGNVTLIR